LSELRVTIAGLTVSVELPHAGWLPPLQPRFGKFLSEQPADMACRLVLDADASRAPGGEPRIEEDETGLYLRHDNFEGHLPPDGPGRLTIFQAGADPEDATYTMVVDSFMRLCLAQLLAARGGAMFHAAGVAVASGTERAAGYVFFGPSGSGKTTVCRLSHPRYRILCDEVIAVRPEGDGVRLYGTPFNGAWGDSLAEDVPLAEMFYLKQAPHTRRAPLRESEGLRALLESAVVYHRSTEFVSSLLDALLGLMKRVPVTQLEFEPKESLWETVLSPTPAR
jgi:hypothetical protein